LANLRIGSCNVHICLLDGCELFAEVGAQSAASSRSGCSRSQANNRSIESASARCRRYCSGVIEGTGQRRAVVATGKCWYRVCYTKQTPRVSTFFWGIMGSTFDRVIG
jgi:hypothetical protein